MLPSQHLTYHQGAEPKGLPAQFISVVSSLSASVVVNFFPLEYVNNPGFAPPPTETSIDSMSKL